MKNIYIIWLFAILSASCTYCPTKEDLSFVENLAINDTLKRSDLVRMDIENQRQIFNKLDNSTKALLYKYKISEDIQSPSVSRIEKKHLTKLLKRTEPDIYAENRDEFNTWCEEWAKEAKRRLKWDDKDLFIYSMTIMTKEEFDSYQNNFQN